MFLVIYCVVVVVLLFIIWIHAFREWKRRQTLMETSELDKRAITLSDEAFNEFEYYTDSFELISKYAEGDSQYRAFLYAFKIGYAVGKSEKGGEVDE